MKMAIVGAGAIGGLLGVKLALCGHEVTYIARNQNLIAINAHGFELIDEAGGRHLAQNVRAVQAAHEAGPQDAVFLCVKAHQVRALLPQLHELLGPQTMLVSMINGLPWWYFQNLAGEFEGRSLNAVDAGGEIARQIDPSRVIGSVVYPAAQLLAPGVVQHLSGNRFTLGELDGARTPRIEALSQAMIAAGFKAPVSKDIRAEIWVKLWGNLCLNPISALTGSTLEQMCVFPPTRELIAQMMTQAAQVANRLGVKFPMSIDKRIAGAQAVGAHKTSMLQDLEADRELELEALLGSVVELARMMHINTPHLDAIYAATSLLGLTRATKRADPSLKVAGPATSTTTSGERKEILDRKAG